jgi:hypothetical protein
MGKVFLCLFKAKDLLKIIVNIIYCLLCWSVSIYLRAKPYFLQTRSPIGRDNIFIVQFEYFLLSSCAD